MSVTQRYQVRSPRYVLQTGDHRLLRYASMDTRGQSSVTKVLNLSESGLAFEIHQDDAPTEGDVLKVEFSVPDQSKIACFATVVRVEPRPAAKFSADTSSAVHEFSDPKSDALSDSFEWGPISEFGHSAHDVIHLVGLQFRNLPTAYRRLLAQGLKDRGHTEVVIDFKNFRRQQLASFAGVSIVTLLMLFILASPCESWFETLKSLF